MLSPVFVFLLDRFFPHLSRSFQKVKDSLNFSGDLTGASKCGMMRKNEKQENPMPNDLPTDRLPTMAETRAMHEQALRVSK